MREKVSMVVYKISAGEILFLVAKRASGVWLYPTGKLEKGESYFDGAFREIKEELGNIKILNFSDLKTDFQFSNEYGDFNENVVAFEIDDVVELQKEEFDEYEFLPEAQAIERLEHESQKLNIKRVGELLNKGRESKFYIFVAPTASGKSIIIKHFLETYPDKFERVKTYMTRPFKRLEDELLRVYVTENEFNQLDSKGLLIEKNLHDGNWYGSSYKLIEQSFRSGKHLIAEIDINGLRYLSKIFHNIVSIFISVPLDQIELRLRERGGHSEEEISRRLEIAKKEISQKDYCDFVVENLQDQLPGTIKNIEEIIFSKIAVKN